MVESTTVTVGLDVHARSIRLAAVRADELLDERTLPYDHAAVGRAVSRWPGAAGLLRGGTDRLRPLPPPDRTRDCLRGGGAGARSRAAGRAS
jgi:hypothetical protein